MSEGPFQARTAVAVAIVAGASFFVALALAIFGPELASGRRTHEPSGYSPGALGHLGLVETLEDLGIPVVLSRFESARKARETSVLIVAEPRGGNETTEAGRPRLEALIDASPFTLLVLPKRHALPDPKRPGWVAATMLLGEPEVEAVLRAAGIDGDVRRLDPDPSPAAFDTAIGLVPTFAPDEPIQVIQASWLAPVVTVDGRILLGRDERRRGLYVLADPDPISNADFHRGENVRFFLRILNAVRDGYTSVVFDETLHGYESSPTIWRELFTFPLVLVPLHLGLLLLLAAWAGMGRFGTPRPAPRELGTGLPFLVDRTAALLREGPARRHALPRYLDVVLRDARRGLDAPPTLRDDALDAWLDRIAANRDVVDRVADLREVVRHARPNVGEVLDAADRIHRWKTEILHGAQ